MALALTVWVACIKIRENIILQDSWCWNSWMVNLHSQGEMLDPHWAEKYNPKSLLCCPCVNNLLLVKWNKWVTAHLERFSLQFLSEVMRQVTSLPLSSPDCWCGQSLVPGTGCSVILLEWWRLGWGWVWISPLLDTWGRWPYGCSIPLLVWAPLPEHIWPGLQVKPAIETENSGSWQTNC